MQNLKFNYLSILFSLLILSLCIYCAIDYLYLNDHNLLIQTFGQQLSINRIEQLIEASKNWQWVGYAFIPIVLFIRISFTSICLYIGCFIANFKVRFKDLFKIAILCDFVFVLSGLAKLIFLIFFKKVYTLEDLQFQPLSLLELFDRSSLDALFIYPFSLISVFELLYWLALVWFLSGLIEKPFDISLKTVASSYGTGLLLWILFVMFLTVNLT